MLEIPVQQFLYTSPFAPVSLPIAPMSSPTIGNINVMCRFYSNILFLNNSFILSKLCFGLWQMKIVCTTQPSLLA
jgi:hypothetical protein